MMQCPEETNCQLCEFIDTCSLRNNDEPLQPELNEDEDDFKDFMNN